MASREQDDPGRGEAVSRFRRRDARYGGRRGFQLPQTSIHRILEINPRGEAALKPLPLKPVCSTLQPTPQSAIGEKNLRQADITGVKPSRKEWDCSNVCNLLWAPFRTYRALSSSGPLISSRKRRRILSTEPNGGYSARCRAMSLTICVFDRASIIFGSRCAQSRPGCNVSQGDRRFARVSGASPCLPNP